jgi:hypothetical protein
MSKFNIKDVGAGAAIVGAAAAVGASISYATYSPTDPNNLFTQTGDAEIGGIFGATAALAGGLVVAVASKKYRNVGLGTVLAAVVAGLALRLTVPPKTSTTLPVVGV